MLGAANVNSDVNSDRGAQFWAYISPDNETPTYVTKWSVTIEQIDGNWSGTITSDNPDEMLQTPGLGGVFNVKVIASGPKFSETVLEPFPDSKPDIGCSPNCAAMVGICATEDGTGAKYWTTWDATCKSP